MMLCGVGVAGAVREWRSVKVQLNGTVDSYETIASNINMMIPLTETPLSPLTPEQERKPQLIQVHSLPVIRSASRTLEAGHVPFPDLEESVGASVDAGPVLDPHDAFVRELRELVMGRILRIESSSVKDDQSQIDIFKKQVLEAVSKIV